MKKFGLLFTTILLLSINQFAQRTLPTNEHFDYSFGELRTVGTDWSRVSGTSNDLNVVTGNLSYTNYPMPAIGNQIQISSSGADDVKLTFTSLSVAGTTIYASFLLNSSNSTGLSLGAYFASLGSGTTSPSYGARCWIRNGSIPGTNFNLGLSRGSNTQLGWSGDLSFNTTYLVVISYEIVTGTANDLVKLWIDPDLSGVEPVAIVSGNQALTSDNSAIDGFFIRQAAGTSNANIDGLRIATTWSQAPLPVELTSFSASVIGNAVKLSWQTATEVNNFGFEVERASLSASPLRVWEKIGFVNGNGNSNSPKSYSYEDKNVTAGKYSYRLKQIDNDGQFEYSKTIEVDFGTPGKFELAQNFPNPFNPETAIRFTLPAASSVKLTVFNLLGQEVKLLVNEYKEAGTHIINFNASDFNSGVYIYRLETNGVTQTRKMTLIK